MHQRYYLYKGYRLYMRYSNYRCRTIYDLFLDGSGEFFHNSFWQKFLFYSNFPVKPEHRNYLWELKKFPDKRSISKSEYTSRCKLTKKLKCFAYFFSTVMPWLTVSRIKFWFRSCIRCNRLRSRHWLRGRCLSCLCCRFAV